MASTALGDSELIVVTGAAGFIASHIVKQLQESGYRVRGTFREEDDIKNLGNLCPNAKFRLQLVEADLLEPESWDFAIKGATYVIHVASPIMTVEPENEDDLIKPAVEGTKSVLEACVKAKTVKRVVMTSSIVAIRKARDVGEDPATEEDWSDLQQASAYAKSKLLAEKAAWDFIEKSAAEDKFELAVINPAYTLGPILNSYTAAMEIPKALLEPKVPALPKLSFFLADVRDVATAHIKALFTPEAAGHRHIVGNQGMWYADMARIYALEFGPQGYSVPTTYVPYVVIWLYSFFNKTANLVLKRIGKESKFDNTRMKEVLGIKPRDIKDTLLDMAYSMIEAGFIEKTSQYKGRPAGTD